MAGRLGRLFNFATGLTRGAAKRGAARGGVRVTGSGAANASRAGAGRTVTSAATRSGPRIGGPKVTGSTGGINPLSYLATQVVRNPIPSALLGYPIVQAGLDYVDPANIGLDNYNAGDLGDYGNKVDLDWADNLRLRIGGALHKGDFGGLVSGPSEARIEDVLVGANAERDAVLRKANPAIDTNAILLGNFDQKIDARKSARGMTESQYNAAVKEDTARGNLISDMPNIENGHEVIMGLDKGASLSTLQGAKTKLLASNRDKAEAKVLEERKRQEGIIKQREDDAAARADATQRLSILLDNQRTKRQDKQLERAREEKRYFEMLDRKERKAVREENRRAADRRQQQEMIALLLGGIRNI